MLAGGLPGTPVPGMMGLAARLSIGQVRVRRAGRFDDLASVTASSACGATTRPPWWSST